MTTIICSLFFKDARRLRILLSAWGIVLAFKLFLYVGGAHFFSSNIEYQMIAPLFYKVVDFLEKVLVVVIIPLCLHEDPCVGTSAFWFSRPLSRRAVIATKALLLGIFLVLIPLLAEAGMLLVSQVAIKYVFLAVPEIILERLSFILPLVLLASLTRRFSDYAKVGAIMVGAWIMLGMCYGILYMVAPKVGQMISGLWSQKQWWGLDVSPSFIQSTKIVGDGLGIIFYAALIIHQHVTRYTARTIRWAVLAYFIIFSVGIMWSIDFLSPQAMAGRKAKVPVEAIQAQFDAGHMFIADGQQEDTPTKIIRSRLLLSDFPSRYFAVPHTESTIQMWYSDGQRLESWGMDFMPMGEFMVDDARIPAMQSALGAAIIKNPWRGQFLYNNIFESGRNDFEKFKSRPGTYAVDAEIDLFDYRIAAAVPLKNGAFQNQGQRQVSILGLLKQENDVGVFFIERNVNMVFDRNGSKQSMMSRMQNREIDGVYVLRNSVTQEAVLPVMDLGQKVSQVADIYNEGLRLQVRAKRIDFDFAQAGIVPSEDWLRQAELVRLEPGLQESVVKKIRIKDFALPAVTTDPDPAAHNSAGSSYPSSAYGRKWDAKPAKDISMYPIPAQLGDEKMIHDYKYNYLAKDDHKAFALSISGGIYGYCYGQKNEAEAKACAWGQCNNRRCTKDPACKILSIDGKIVP
ncbi:MAG: hypothetical protein WCI27_06600 [Candidatus Omnitrophota bacterium]